MSIESVAIALHHSRAKGTAKLVLLGIANHDGDYGAFPKVATLAKYANVHPRRIPEALKTLGELGEIIVHVQDGGMRMHVDALRPNLYEFVLECPPECDRTKHHRIAGEKIGRSYAGQYDPTHEKDPERVERGREGRRRRLEAVENATIPPSDENSTSDGNSTRASDGNSTRASAENSTTKNHKTEPQEEYPFAGHVTSDSAAVENMPAQPPAVSRRNDATTAGTDEREAFGLPIDQISRNKAGAALARAALRGQISFNEAKDHERAQ